MTSSDFDKDHLGVSDSLTQEQRIIRHQENQTNHRSKPLKQKMPNPLINQTIMTEKEILRQEHRKNIILSATETKEKNQQPSHDISCHEINPIDNSPTKHTDIEAHDKKPYEQKKSVLRIGTRGSPLALAQANYVKSCLSPKIDCEIVVIHTSGDKFLDSKLQDLGGKGLFTKEIEQALLENKIDLAVHSMKDVPTYRQVGLEISAILPREDVRDCLISEKYHSLLELPQNARVGTASLRRKSQLLRIRPDLRIELLRGNVQTRLSKVASGEFDATLLALAGLNRLGLSHYAKEVFAIDFFPPAPAQGAIGIETATCLRNDFKELIYGLNCDKTKIEITAERSFLRSLDGNCRTPIAAFAYSTGGMVHLIGQILSEDGQKLVFRQGRDLNHHAEHLGINLGLEVKMEFDGFDRNF